ncbi:MAG: hypothetical protein HY721_04005, partial [Planctomycetes bacterium]|nr:hypothetical protein [Planctomycetota bacterium]
MRVPVRGLFILLALAFAAPLFGDADPLAPWRPPDDRIYTVTSIRCETSGVFEHREHRNALFKAADLLHFTTRRHVVCREVLLREGVVYDPWLASETERNLRALEFIAFAEVKPEFQPDGTVDVLVRTRDKFSFELSAAGALVGGVSAGRGTLGEENAFGLGKQLEYSVERHDDGRERREVEYEDAQLLGSRWELEAKAATGTAGGGVEAVLFRPFRSRLDDWACVVEAVDDETDREFFDAGKLVYREPVLRAGLAAGFARAWGPRDARWRLNVAGRWADTDFAQDEAVGIRPADLPPSRDETKTELVAGPGFDGFGNYSKRVNLDSMDFVQDVPEGIDLGMRTGVSFRRIESGPLRHLVPLEADLTGSVAQGAHLSTFKVGFASHLDAGELTDYRVSAFYHHYWQRPESPWQTVAWSIAFDRAFDRNSAVGRYTLGEDSGLRGYDAREFSGTHRLRINAEQRVRTPVTVGGFRLGTVVFADSGLAWGPDRSLSARD